MQKTQRIKKRSLARRLLYWCTVLVIWGMVGFGGLVGYVYFTLPEGDVFSLPERSPSVTVLAANGEVIAQRGTFKGDDVTFSELPHHLPQAVISIEDRRFYSHFGIDPIGLLRAIYVNFKAGRIVQGGSTLTQQLAKNLFLKPERTFKRKLQEAVLAIWLETKYSKKEIVQLYLNRVYFGAGAYGVEAASSRYFGKSARQLNLAESAMLAGLLKAPSRYSPKKNPKGSETRAFLVLKSMVKQGYISSKEGQMAVNNPAGLSPRVEYASNQYVVDWVMERLPGYIGAVETDIVVQTTIDVRLQKIAEQKINEFLRDEGKQRGASQAAFVLLNNQGHIKSIVGGRSYSKSQFNRAVKAYRQPGSAFKPFVYLTALEAGFTPDSLVRDGPININGWKPKNYANKYAGDMRMRDALAISVNTVPAKLIQTLGPKKVVNTARRLGITTPLRAHPSLALGTSEVNLLELTAAYVPFSNGGYGALPHVIRVIGTRDGKELYRREGTGSGFVIKPENVAQMNSMLSSALTYGTGKHARFSGHALAGKTGTSQGERDAWFVGYSASLIGGVWVGNDTASKMKGVTGGGMPARIWRSIMKPAHVAINAKPLPGGIEEHDTIQVGHYSGFEMESNTIINEQLNAPVQVQPSQRNFFERLLGIN